MAVIAAAEGCQDFVADGTGCGRHIEAALEKVRATRTLKDAKKILLNAIAASRKHFDKEERIVFPLAERILKAKTLNDLGEEWLQRRQVGK